MYTIKENGMKVPAKIWAEKGTIEEDCIKQLKNISSLPFAFHHTALMPDGHVGYGMPIGGVLATKDVIIPNAVGVDISCGMCAVKTSLKGIELDTLKKIMREIRQKIPVGFEKHKGGQEEKFMPKVDFGYVVKREYSNALRSVGTLGGGNHFVEIFKGSDSSDSSDKNIWIMVHSGSRNLGKQVADYYNRLAINLNREERSIRVPPEWQLAFLWVNSKEGQEYIKEMNYCVAYSFANRKLMTDRVKDVFREFFNNIEFDEMINIAHNYAQLEKHFGEDVWVHRKGATSAKKGEIGIIPGSQGTKSYIVEGLGNEESFTSCSHGAGRVMGRKEAIRKLNLEEEIKKLDKMGMLHSIRGRRDLEEAPSVYKDIEDVMRQQKDLVKIKVGLTPMAVIIG